MVVDVEFVTSSPSPAFPVITLPEPTVPIVFEEEPRIVIPAPRLPRPVVENSLVPIRLSVIVFLLLARETRIPDVAFWVMMLRELMIFDVAELSEMPARAFDSTVFP